VPSYLWFSRFSTILGKSVFSSLLPLDGR
jgi:hypothetical protein